jgi:hypothetical protein
MLGGKDKTTRTQLASQTTRLRAARTSSRWGLYKSNPLNPQLKTAW